jgi:hypothetical protein
MSQAIIPGVGKTVGTDEIEDGAVTTQKIADNAVTLEKMEHGNHGDILFYGENGAPARLPAGTSGYILATRGAGADPVWQSAATPGPHSESHQTGGADRVFISQLEYSSTDASLGKADTVDGIHASATPTANYLYPLNDNALFPDSIVTVLSAGSQGDIIYRDATGWARLTAGTAGQFLKTQGAGANPIWADAAIAIDDVLKAIENYGGVFWFNNNWLPAGMIFNSTTGSGTQSWSNGEVRLNTGTTAGSTSVIEKVAHGITSTAATGVATWDKNRYFHIRVYFSTYTNQIVHITSGGSTATVSGNIDNHIGFKLINGDLYGTVANGTSESTLFLETLTTSGYKYLKAVLTAGTECRFYVDGVDKGAITTNLPTGTSYASSMVRVTIYNTLAEDKSIRVQEVRTLQVE